MTVDTGHMAKNALKTQFSSVVSRQAAGQPLRSAIRGLCMSAAVALAIAQTPAVHAAPKSKTKAVAVRAPKTVNPLGPVYATRPEVTAWAQDMAVRRGLEPDWVLKAVGSAHRLPLAEKLMTPALRPTQKNWQIYRSRFIDSVRIRAGVAFWNEHAATLAQAEAQFGVAPEVIVGILGVETLFGRDMGSFRVIDALTTLAFDFPKAHRRAAERQQFFLGELEQYLSLQSRAGTDPMLALGSYAGAMGLPQFMPSSWARYAIDFDGDGRIDLFSSPADAIGSVANYFKGYGWKPGQPTHFAAQFAPAQSAQDRDDLLLPDILPSFSAQTLIDKGLRLDAAASEHMGPMALVELKNGDQASSFVLGTENFYVITRYNWSASYAMAVIELAQAIKLARVPR